VECDNFEQNLPQEPVGLKEDEKEEFWSFYVDDADELGNRFPQIMRYSLFVYSYSFFERTLINISYRFYQLEKLATPPPDREKMGIEEAKNYLKKIALVPFPTNSAWRVIKTLNRVRNVVVHKEGVLPREVSKEEKAIQALPKKWRDDISLESYKIEFSPEFIFHVLDTFHAFFDELFLCLQSSRGTEDVV